MTAFVIGYVRRDFIIPVSPVVQMVVIVVWSMGGFYVIDFFPVYTFEREAVLKLAAENLVTQYFS